MHLSQTAIHALREIVGADAVLTDANDLAVYSVDGTTHCQGSAEVVVFPTDAGQIAQIMRLADKDEIPVTVRGAGTSLSGGPVPVAGGIVLCTARMNRILDIDGEDFTVKAEVGVVLNDLNQALAAKNLFFPPDPQSFLAATLGGCVSENAGGPYAVKYGVFRHYLLGLTAVLANGKIVNLGGNTMKNVTGYDLPQIICGAEGTLAVITDVTLRLLPKPQASQTVLAIFDQVVTAGSAVHQVRASGVIPAKIELMDNWVVRRIEERLPLGIPLTAEAILLFELDGAPASVRQETETVIELCRQAGAVDVRAARDAAEAGNFWTARRAGFSAVFSAAPTVFAEDVTVPTHRIADQITHTQRLARKYDLTIAIIGHAGDGNLHPCILTDKNDADHFARAQKAADEIFAAALEFGGAISGEHGIGLEKQRFLKDAMAPDAILLLKGIKRAFDPKGLLNPGKIWENE
ncbi:FAD-binding protein [Desulfosarcina ovata subsp. sediminis]|uniref:FAD-binding protein n=1 Tax=Desulfosarcina ovata subsp. sediminis TaxID=885957 RepID=A0A5K7ZVF0_9BACT|nr:FAD-linked oxidase C-terminal domain-containing protein [Desulfosarcina ovata]BBO84209.1 FAD-binding protein [Desulfosarcina ovata subsp. sediminis]